MNASPPKCFEEIDAESFPIDANVSWQEADVKRKRNKKQNRTPSLLCTVFVYLQLVDDIFDWFLIKLSISPTRFAFIFFPFSFVIRFSLLFSYFPFFYCYVSFLSCFSCFLTLSTIFFFLLPSIFKLFSYSCLIYSLFSIFFFVLFFILLSSFPLFNSNLRCVIRHSVILKISKQTTWAARKKKKITSNQETLVFKKKLMKWILRLRKQNTI